LKLKGKTNPFQLIVALILSIVFILLGFWQLQRAGDMKETSQPKLEQAAVAIETLVKPNTNLSATAINRIVELSGSYAKTYYAPNQEVKIEGKKEHKSLEVRLMKLNSGSGVLVVRGYETMQPQSITANVKVIGRLYPRQSGDVSDQAANQLSRIDPSLIVGETNLNLIDGYVVAVDEQTALGETIWNPRVSAERVLPKVAGYYWQHLAYVGIWWLFALLVLAAPFYDRLRDRKLRVG